MTNITINPNDTQQVHKNFISDLTTSIRTLPPGTTLPITVTIGVEEWDEDRTLPSSHIAAQDDIHKDTTLLELSGCSISYQIDKAAYPHGKMKLTCGNSEEEIDTKNSNYGTDSAWYNQLSFVVSEQIRFHNIINVIHPNVTMKDYIAMASNAANKGLGSGEGLKCNGVLLPIYNKWMQLAQGCAGKIAKISPQDNMRKMVFDTYNTTTWAPKELKQNYTETLKNIANNFDLCTKDSVASVECKDLYTTLTYKSVESVNLRVLSTNDDYTGIIPSKMEGELSTDVEHHLDI